MIIIQTNLAPDQKAIEALALREIQVIDLAGDGAKLIVPAAYHDQARLNCRKDGQPVNWRVLQDLGVTQLRCHV
jgi:hypothetical protein